MISLQWGQLGLGTSAIGNLYKAVTDDAANEVVSAAWNAGIRYFDSAPHYGLGLAEQRLGKALADRPRDEFVVSTKVGRVLEPNSGFSGELDDEGFVIEARLRRRWDFSARGVRDSLESSLERLGLDRIDVLLLHDPEAHLDQAESEALPELVGMRDEGIVSAIGVGSKHVPTITRLVGTGHIDVAMVAGRYTLLEQPALPELLPAAVEHETAVIAVGVFNSGLLASSHPDENSTYDYGPVPAEILARAQQLARTCADHDVELPHAALQFVLAHPAIVNVTIGVGSASHVASSARWASTPVPAALWTELLERGLIPRGTVDV